MLQSKDLQELGEKRLYNIDRYLFYIPNTVTLMWTILVNPAVDVTLQV